MVSGGLVYFMKNMNTVQNKQAGYTLLESIISLMIVSAVLFMIPILLHIYVKLDHSVRVKEDFDWNLYLIQLRKELQGSEKVDVRRQRIFIYKNNMMFTHEIYGNMLRRRVNDRGHEIVLHHIVFLNFIEDDQRLIMNVEFENGIKEQAHFKIPK